MQKSSNYHFVKFTRVDPRSLDSYISLRKGSIIGLSAGFYQNNRIDQYRYVELFVDVKKRLLGLKFTNSESEDSRFSVVKSSNANSARVMARSFFNNSSLSMDKYVDKIYYPKEISLRDAGIGRSGSMFVVSLEEGKGGRPK